jgi:hypothetical protein
MKMGVGGRGWVVGDYENRAWARLLAILPYAAVIFTTVRVQFIYLRHGLQLGEDK